MGAIIAYAYGGNVLQGAMTGMGVVAIATDWAVIVACFAAVVWLEHGAVWLLAAFVIATWQHAVAVFMHDAAHFRLCRNPAWNDRLGNWLLAY